MCYSYTEFSDIYMCIFSLIATFWILFSCILYVCQNSNGSSKLLFNSNYLNERPCSGSPLNHFEPPGCSTPIPNTSTSYEHGNEMIGSEGPSQALSNERSCNPGVLTNNPWLNFLRYVRTKYCGIRQRELFQRAASLWESMSEDEKQPFRRLAETIKNSRSRSQSSSSRR